MEREIPEVTHKINHIEGCIEGCLDHAEKLQFQSTLERVENEEDKVLRQDEEQLREKENLLLAQQGMLGHTAATSGCSPGYCVYISHRSCMLLSVVCRVALPRPQLVCPM